MPEVESDAFELKVTVLETDPAIWRRVLVPRSLTLDQLHRVLQVVVGWENRHLYEFEIKARSFGPIDEDVPEDLGDATEVEVRDVVSSGDTLFYDYDFGDAWRLEIEVASASASEESRPWPVCSGGERAGPPEDCGGPDGYAELLEVLADPAHEDHEELLSWVGKGFDPASFSPVTVNAALERAH
jgi:hypothetical protein